MLLRFIAKNIFSFKEETEFNLFPNKTQRLQHHKVKQNEFDVLRLSAIYGANGSGKSNLIKAISLLESMIEEGKINNDSSEIKFKLSDENKDIPISLGIEFYAKSKIYYYAITFDMDIVLSESLVESRKDIDILIFERSNESNTQTILFHDGYNVNEKNKFFVDVLAEKLLQKNELLLSFLNSKYKEEFIDVSNAYNWFDSTLVIIKPDAKPGGIAQILDTNRGINDFANIFFSNLNTGISKINVDKKKYEEFSGSADIRILDCILDDFKKGQNRLSVLTHSETGEEATLVYENGEVFVKRLVTSHSNDKGVDIEFSIGMESDGTKRLIDYIPALNGIINEDKVYLIDEIERSIHPITIKAIITKISFDQTAKGQLIFTTHESCLLDQEIFRPDEIWFAQKDVGGASKLYSLSDFNIHNTANIENGYLNGRYGGIPFLSNLHDLNWHKYEVSQ
ncbi:MAG: AAA family ATPase [Bacteroidetes bacterium]|nr:AAA family ATPase [Bacteroidota bacterium]MBU1721031.1 AAA family ATPase [Bacteroidota bacterium]